MGKNRVKGKLYIKMVQFMKVNGLIIYILGKVKLFFTMVLFTKEILIKAGNMVWVHTHAQIGYMLVNSMMIGGQVKEK